MHKKLSFARKKMLFESQHVPPRYYRDVAWESSHTSKVDISQGSNPTVNGCLAAPPSDSEGSSMVQCMRKIAIVKPGEEVLMTVVEKR